MIRTDITPFTRYTRSLGGRICASGLCHGSFAKFSSIARSSSVAPPAADHQSPPVLADEGRNASGSFPPVISLVPMIFRFGFGDSRSPG